MAYVSLPDFRLPGETDDNKALERALGQSLTVYLPSGRGAASNGDYRIGINPFVDGDYHRRSRGNLPSGATLYGDGSFRTVVRQIGPVVFLANSDSSDTAQNIRDVTIRDMTLYGNIETEGLDENAHNLQLSGVSNFLAERVEFRGFRGDGIFMGSPAVAIPTHNQGVTIRSCRFDGLNGQNRNGVSIVDCVDWLIDGCAFLNMTRPDMPGAIDIEPEKSFNRVARGRVLNCSFNNVGGWALALFLGPQTRYENPINDIEFAYCNIQNVRGAISLLGFAGGAEDSVNSSQPFNVRVHDLYVVGVSSPFEMRGAYGLSIVQNTFRDSDMSVILSGSTSRDVVINNNGFVNCGRVNGPVIAQDGSVLNLQVMYNHVIDSGASGLVSPFYFLRSLNGVGTVRTLRLNNNTIECQTPPNRITDIGRVVGGYTGTLQDVQKVGNQIVNCTLTGPDNLA